MSRLLDLISAPAIAAYWTETQSNRVPYLGEGLFPVKKKRGLSLAWIKGHKGLPVALKPAAFDAKAEVRDRIEVTEIKTRMPFFRESMRLGEEERQELLMLEEANPAFYKNHIREIYDDRINLIKGALVQGERMRMQMLQGGKINITAAGVVYVYDFDEDGEYAANNTLTLTGSDQWSDLENSDPIEDLQTAMDKVEERSGSRPVRAIMTRKTWSYLLRNKSIKMDMNVLSGDKIILTDSMLHQYLAGKLGLEVAIYSKRFQDENGVEKAFFEDGNVSLLPEGALGNTWYGTTPEEANLMAKANVDVEIVETGVAVTSETETHTVNVETIVSEIVLPSFERMDETFLLKVA